MRGMICSLLFVVSLSGDGFAQTLDSSTAARVFSEAEISAITMPNLADKPDANDVATFDKYFFFHRAETSFDEAFADINECDSLSSGISYYRGSSEPYAGYYATQYGIGGAIGGALGAVLADAIFGSAERRKVRRINMRNCLGYKGYQRYGLSKELWKEFNFEEGSGREEAAVRDKMILMQARVASGPLPQLKVIEP